MNKPKVTVYIPNFNYEKYIEKAINSVLEQTYKNIEIIIIDDGSINISSPVILRTTWYFLFTAYSILPRTLFVGPL